MSSDRPRPTSWGCCTEVVTCHVGFRPEEIAPLLPTGLPSGITRPWRGIWRAASVRSSVTRLAAPRSSALPQRPQFPTVAAAREWSSVILEAPKRGRRWVLADLGAGFPCRPHSLVSRQAGAQERCCAGKPREVELLTEPDRSVHLMDMHGHHPADTPGVDPRQCR